MVFKEKSSSFILKEGGVHMKKLIFIVVAVLFMTFPAFLGSARDASAAEPIKIGAVLDFTGPVADLGPKFKAGIELALEEVGY
jgi:hypothetical protein